MNKLRSLYKNLYFFELINFLCASETCNTIHDDGFVTSYDGDHITNEASLHILNFFDEWIKNNIIE